MVVCIRVTSFQLNLGFQNQPTLSTELITQSVQQAMNDVKLALTFQSAELEFEKDVALLSPGLYKE